MKSARGFSLIETMVAVASLVIFFAAVSAMVDMSLKIMGRARAESVAATVGQSKVELANNLPYEDLGTIGGIPAGVLPAEEVVMVNNAEYNVKTDIVYVDDPFDGEAPADLVPIDYKRVRVEVDWEGAFAPAEPVVFWNDVAPRGLEQLEGAGTLLLTVFDADGLPVSGADVTIEADDVDPAVSVNTSTDIDGRVLLPGALECVECYQVSVTKTNFTTDRTYGSEEVTNPEQPHLSVFEGQVTEQSFVIDEHSDMIIQSFRGPAWGYQPFDNINLRVYGTKEIGRNEFDEPVYKVDQIVNTGPSGQITVEDIEWDTYQVDLVGGLLEVTGSWKILPTSFQPGGVHLFKIVIGNNTTHSLRVVALADEETPLENVEVRVRHDALTYDVTQTVADLGLPDQGQAYFANLNTSNEPYEITLNLTGYEEASASATVSADLVETIIMTPISP